MRKDLTKGKHHEESTLHFEMRKHPVKEGGIRGNSKIGPVLDVKFCYRQGRYGVEIVIDCLFRKPNSFSWFAS